MDWQKLLSAMVPLGVGVGAGVAGKPLQGASFIEGFQGADQLMWRRRMEEEEAARRAAALESEQANRAHDNKRLDAQARLQRLSLALQQMGPAMEQQIETAPDPMAAQQSLGNQSRLLERSFELPQGAMRPFAPDAQSLAPMIDAAKIRKAKGTYAEFLKLTGERAEETEASFTYQSGPFAGMTAAQVREIADMPPPSKKQPTPRQEPAGGSFEEFVDAPPDRKAAILAARKEYQQVDDRAAAGGRQRFQVQQVTNPDGTTGLIRVNLDTGESTRVNLPTDVAGAGRPTSTEQVNIGYLQRSVAANATAQSFESQLASLGRQFDVQFPNLLRTPEGQRYRQAQDEFINAALRRESGAAIQPSEYDRFAKIYFVMPGDTRETITQKQGARKRVIEGFQTGAGNLRGSGRVEAPSSGKVRARDPQGKLHEAPAGTPVPKGWTVEP